jgi:hypothetical protein
MGRFAKDAEWSLQSDRELPQRASSLGFGWLHEFKTYSIPVRDSGHCICNEHHIEGSHQ